MGNIRSIADEDRPQILDGLAADQRTALLARAFEIELSHDDHERSWPMGQTMWFAVLVSGALWGLIYAIVRLI